jgi:hypothetical protein
MYKITLSDGSQIENLELNGNNFIAKKELSNAVFEGKLSTVRILDLETQTEEVHEDMVLISNRVNDGKSWFILGEKSEREKKEEAISSTFTDIEMALAEVYEMIIGG